MPIYEYRCVVCNKEFEELVRGEELPSCPHCNSEKSEKLMSRPYAHVAGESSVVSSHGGGCAGCSGGNCATCR